MKMHDAISIHFVPISTIAYATLPKEENGDAAALFSMARNVSGGIGISISTALVNDHLQSRQARMIEHLTPVNQPYNDLIQQVQQGLGSGQSMTQAVLAAPGKVFEMLRCQLS